jgi:integrase
MGRLNWVKRWKRLIRPTRTPGIYELKEGGHLVRARVVDPTTGQQREIKKVMPQASEAQALEWLDQERDRIRAGLVLVQPARQRFADFAVSLLERKIKKLEIRSSAGKSRWTHTLQHLIAGTTSDDDKLRATGFGEFFLDQLRPQHVEAWKESIAEFITAGLYSPHSANGWLSVLRVIAKAAKRELGLSELFTDGVTNFDTTECATYSEEQPNSLAPEDVPRFLSKLLELYPQHFAMTFLGLATGLRPSSLRPLRRRGDEPDVLWEKKRLLVRRSQTHGTEVLNRTKQRTRYAIDLPAEVLDVLEWHVRTQLTTPEQWDSDLLFPSVTGSFRSACVLNKPFADVAEEIELGYVFTQRGMRRTFQDLARAAQVESLVTRSISGHATERMQHHYSTVRSEEQRSSIGKVIGLMSPTGSNGLLTAANDETETFATPRNCTETVQSGAPSGAPEQDHPGAPPLTR